MSIKNRLATVTIGAAIAALAILASPGEASAAPLSCSSIEFIGALFDTTIEAELDERVAGQSYRISSRKTLVINGIEDVRITGCEITVVADVTLKRKIRRNAHGTVTIKANIAVNSLGSSMYDLWFSNIRVADVSLSHTTSIGESIYRWVANKVLPDDQAIRIEL